MKRNLYYVLCLFVILLLPSIAFSEFITPSVGKAQPGETVTYTVHLDTGQYDYDPVNWAPSGGSISSLGISAIWTAPSQEGTYDIKASGWKCPKGKGKEKGGCEKIPWSAHASGKSIKPIISDLVAKPTNLIADGKQTSTITARVTWDGKPKSKITVNFSLLNNLGSLDKTGAVTDANGKAEVIFTVGKKPGTEAVTGKVGESSKSVNIVIEPKLERTIIEGPNYVAQGQSVKYNAKAYDIENKEWSYGNLSYQWYIDGKKTPTAIPSELSYPGDTTAFNTIGNHTISVIVTYKTQSKNYDKKITVFEVKISPETRQIWDGESGGQFTIVLNPSSISVVDKTWSWSWELPPYPEKPGNGPSCNFNPTDKKPTTVTTKWYAYPDRDCPATTAFSTYTIKCAVTVDGISTNAKTSSLTVTLPDTAGDTWVFLYGEVAINSRVVNGNTEWYVSGTGTLKREVSKVIYVNTNSQFYNKVNTHEEVHVTQFTSGRDKDVETIAEFYPRVSGFTAETEKKLRQLIDDERAIYDKEEVAEVKVNRVQDERDAYNVSDPIKPQYLYQNCGQY